MTRPARAWQAARTALLFAAAGLSPVTATPHEIGTTRIVIWVGLDRYRIEIVTDAQALADKLALAAGRTSAKVAAADDLARRIDALGALFLDRTSLTFDSARVRPNLSVAVAAAVAGGAPVATLQLTGAIPPGARTLQWAYGWTYASYALSLHRPEDTQATTEWLEGGQPSAVAALQRMAPVLSRRQVASRYLVLGVTHIVPYGFDHVLFVLGIFLLTRRVRPMLAQITAFTVAHSITLGLSVFGVVNVSASVVEPMIALSIAYLAMENLIVRRLTPWRLALVFCFGLLHGLGFAGALRELGLPRAEFVTALVTFNLGVEVGQLTVIATAFVLVGHWFANREWYRARVIVPASSLIAAVGLFWTIQRLRLW